MKARVLRKQDPGLHPCPLSPSSAVAVRGAVSCKAEEESCSGATADDDNAADDGAADRYPLVAPARRPRTKNLWSEKNTMSGTMIEMKAPAVSSSHDCP